MLSDVLLSVRCKPEKLRGVGLCGKGLKILGRSLRFTSVLLAIESLVKFGRSFAMQKGSTLDFKSIKRDSEDWPNEVSDWCWGVEEGFMR